MMMRLPVVPLYARSLGISTVQIGIINSAFFMVAGILSFPLGILSDRLGRKMLAGAGLIILSSSAFLLCFSKTFVQLTTVYLFFGIGTAAFGPTMMSFAADISPPTHLGRSYGWYTTAVFCGLSLGPAAGGFIAQKTGFTQVFLIAGIFIFLNFWLLMLFLPRSHVYESGKQKWTTVAREFLRNRTLLSCWLVTLGGCIGLGMFITFIPLHARNHNLSVGQIGLVFSAQGLCNAVFRIPFGHLSDRIGQRKIPVIVGIAGFAASMAGFALSETLTHFVIFAATLGISMGLAFTSVGALIAESVPPASRGLAMGGYNTCIYFGMMLSSGLMGTVIQMTGFKNAFFIIALINCFTAILFYFLTRQSGPDI